MLIDTVVLCVIIVLSSLLLATDLLFEDDESKIEERVRSVLEECDIDTDQDLTREDLSAICQQLSVNLPEEQVRKTKQS